jgi:hypothetical protein
MSKKSPALPGILDESAPPERHSRARQSFSSLVPPKPRPDVGDVVRETWIEETFRGFVNPSNANRAHYRLVLETLWPAGHGIPGPHIRRDQIREALDQARIREGKAPYRDPFRRVREMQGEEGLRGIIRKGQTWQLVDLTVSGKRIPRTALTGEDWVEVLRRYDNACANCKRRPPEVRLQQDHKVPRVREDKTAQLEGGADALDNWQPLCDECNNFKSTSCRGCGRDCFVCPWAYPEKYKALMISPENTARLLECAKEKGTDPDDLINEIIEGYLEGL